MLRTKAPTSPTKSTRPLTSMAQNKSIIFSDDQRDNAKDGKIGQYRVHFTVKDICFAEISPEGIRP